jgi:hypothetical protein
MSGVLKTLFGLSHAFTGGDGDSAVAKDYATLTQNDPVKTEIVVEDTTPPKAEGRAVEFKAAASEMSGDTTGGAPERTLEVEDWRDKSPKFVAFATGMKSGDGIFILYRGTDSAVFEQIQQGAQAALDQGAKINGVGWADTHEEEANGQENYRLFIKGVPVTKPDLSKEDIAKTVEALVTRANETYKEYLVKTENNNNPELGQN